MKAKVYTGLRQIGNEKTQDYKWGADKCVIIEGDFVVQQNPDGSQTFIPILPVQSGPALTYDKYGNVVQDNRSHQLTVTPLQVQGGLKRPQQQLPVRPLSEEQYYSNQYEDDEDEDEDIPGQWSR